MFDHFIQPNSDNSWLTRKDELQAYARAIDSSVTLVAREGWFWRVLSIFMANAAITVGPIQAYPPLWSYYQVLDCIPHESRHTKQYRWFGFGISPWVGILLFMVAYLLLPIPFGLSWVRYRLELDACCASWRLRKKAGATKDEVVAMALRSAIRVSSSNYGWAWPESWAVAAYKNKVEKLFA